jgi:hypothetical protein
MYLTLSYQFIKLEFPRNTFTVELQSSSIFDFVVLMGGNHIVANFVLDDTGCSMVAFFFATHTLVYE